MEKPNPGLLAVLAAALHPVQEAIKRHVLQLVNPGHRSRGRAGPGAAIRKRIRENFKRRREARNRMAHESRRKNRGVYRGR